MLKLIYTTNKSTALGLKTQKIITFLCRPLQELTSPGNLLWCARVCRPIRVVSGSRTTQYQSWDLGITQDAFSEEDEDEELEEVLALDSVACQSKVRCKLYCMPNPDALLTGKLC